MNQQNAPTVHFNSVYLVDKASNASFSDAGWIANGEDAKCLWLCVKIGTAVSGALSLVGALRDTAVTFGLALPSTLAVHATAAGGSAALSGNTIALTNFTGVLAIAFSNPPPNVRLDLTRTSGGAAAGTNGLQASYFSRGM